MHLSITTKYVAKVVFDFYTKSEKVSLTAKQMTQNLLITGSTGSGKTRGVILPIVYALLESNSSGLIMDLKDEMCDYILAMAEKLGKKDKVCIIGNRQSSQFFVGLKFR